ARCDLGQGPGLFSRVRRKEELHPVDAAAADGKPPAVDLDALGIFLNAESHLKASVRHCERPQPFTDRGFDGRRRLAPCLREALRRLRQLLFDGSEPMLKLLQALLRARQSVQLGLSVLSKGDDLLDSRAVLALKPVDLFGPAFT